jgi:N-acetylmuramoyl-L-alanine amidase
MPDPVAGLTERDLDTATRTLWGECRGEPTLGQQAVAWVIRTRATWQPERWWGHNVSEVCWKCARNKHGIYVYQFSCWQPDGPNYKGIIGLAPDDQEYLTLREIARSVMAGEVEDPTGGATHYERVGTNAMWRQGRTPSAVIGLHEFFAIGPGA